MVLVPKLLHLLNTDIFKATKNDNQNQKFQKPLVSQWT